MPARRMPRNEGMDPGGPGFSIGLLVVAAPMVLCFTLPLMRLAGKIYIYDLLTMLAIACMVVTPSGKAPQLARTQGLIFSGVIFSFGVGLILSFIHGIEESDVYTYSFSLFGQYGLALVYAKLLYSKIAEKQIQLSKLAAVLALAAAVAAGITILQAIMFRIKPDIALALQSRYLAMNGFNDVRFVNQTNSTMNTTGLVRVSGGWDSATSMAGIIALGSVPLMFTRWKLWSRMMVFTLLAIGALSTVSRHGIAILACAMVFLFLQKRVSLVQQMLVGVAIFLFVLIATVVVSAISDSRKSAVLGITEAIESRIFSRTFEEGTDDSSFQARYIDGTQRYFDFVKTNPSSLLFGYGLGRDQNTGQKSGLSTAGVMTTGTLNNGFVSDSWLLVSWQFGLWGFLGLAILHLGLLRSRDVFLGGTAIIIGLIFLADNYAVDETRAFFLLISMLALGWGAMTLRYDAAMPMQHRRPHPIRPAAGMPMGGRRLPMPLSR